MLINFKVFILVMYKSRKLFGVHPIERMSYSAPTFNQCVKLPEKKAIKCL